MNDILEITTLGGLEIRVRGEPVTGLDSRKAEALLVYLACTGRTQSREVLADLLWDELTQSRALANLRVVLHSLRQRLGSYIQATRTTVGLDPESDYWLDAADLEEHLAVARELGGVVSAEIAEDVEKAASLYEGDFLAGFFVQDCRRFEEWLLVEQERLRGMVTAALDELARYNVDSGAPEVALLHARRLLELDPLLESAHRHVMRSLAQSGQRASALAQYERCCLLLDEELGVEPDPETTALYQRIAAGEIAAAAEAAAQPRHNLPLPLTPFVEREAELAEITALLEDPDCRLLTLVGPGGSGKTRLALEVAERQLVSNEYPHGVFFVSLASLSTPEGIVPTVADAIGCTFYAEERAGQKVEAQQQLLDYLRGKTMLLVMDNYEHLLSPPEAGMQGGTALVTDILRTVPTIKILATSRARLNVGGEHRLHVTGMDYPSRELLAAEPETAATYSAVKLFLQGAHRARPEFVPSADVLQDIADVCRAVDGMPLAIRLAAGWMEMLIPAEIADEIDRSLDFLETERHDVPARQQSMRAVFDHSWRLLTERERRVMQALSVFRGGFTADAAQAVSGASLRVLMTLVNRSLLHRTPEGRYEIHELLRQYAAQELADSPDGGDAVRDRHSAYYCAALKGWGEDLWCERQDAAIAALRADRENARAAWDWAVERGHVERLDQAIFGLSYFYVWRGRYDEGESACRSAVEKLEAMAVGAGAGATFPDPLRFGAGTAEPRDRVSHKEYPKAEVLRVWAKTLACYAFVVDCTGRKEHAFQLAQQSLAFSERPELAGRDTRWEQAYALLQMGDAAWGLVKIEDQQQLYERSLALYQDLGVRWGIAKVLLMLGRVQQETGTSEIGREMVEESLTIQRELGDKRRMANTLSGLGWRAAFQGRLGEAERLTREGIAFSAALGDRAYFAIGRRTLGHVLFFQGRYVEAHDLFEEVVVLFDDLGAQLNLGSMSRIYLGLTDLALGRYDAARAQGQSRLARARQAGYPSEIGWSFYLLGAVALASGTKKEAEKLLRESMAFWHEPEDRAELSWTLVTLGIAREALGRAQLGRQHVCDGLRTAIEMVHFPLLLQVLAAAALLMAGEGDAYAERAVEFYALASRYDYVANSRWFDDVAGKHISAVAATLPPEVVAAAQERGRARELWATAQELLEELGA